MPVHDVERVNDPVDTSTPKLYLVTFSFNEDSTIFAFAPGIMPSNNTCLVVANSTDEVLNMLCVNPDTRAVYVTKTETDDVTHEITHHNVSGILEIKMLEGYEVLLKPTHYLHNSVTKYEGNNLNRLVCPGTSLKYPVYNF